MIAPDTGEFVEVAWGYDNPLQGYFFQVFSMNDKGENDETLIDVGNDDSKVRFDRENLRSNAQILELMIKYDCPEEHRDAITMDIPF